MERNIRETLQDFIVQGYGKDAGEILSYLPAQPVDLSSIQAVMINEVVADTPEDDFYSAAKMPYYMQTTLPLFQKAGADVQCVQDILDLGVYITSVVKRPKEGSVVEAETIRRYLPVLKKELELFSSLKAIMLMGDVARKAFNWMEKDKTRKNVIPSVSTYKLRHAEIVYNGIRLLPAYIMTGKNLAIEKSKMEMSAEELAKMLDLIGTTT